MNKHNKPSRVFGQVRSLKNQYSSIAKNDQEDKIAIVQEKVPKEDAGILANTEREYGSNLTTEHIEKAMKLQY